MQPRLLHADFFATADFYASSPFDVNVERNLIDVPIVEDRSLAATPQQNQVRAIERSKARARLTLRFLSVSTLIAGATLFIVGIGLSIGGVEPVGTALGGVSLILIPAGTVMIVIDAIRRVARKRRR